MNDVAQTAPNAAPTGVQQAISSGRGFFGDLLMAPFDALGTAFHWALMPGLPLLGIFYILPTLPHLVLKTLGGQAWCNKAVALVNSGWVNTSLAVVGLSAGVGAGWSSIKSVLGGIFGSRSSSEDGQPAQSTGSSLGTIIGGGLVMAAVSAIAIGAVHHIHLDDADASLPSKAPQGPQPGAGAHRHA